MIGEVLSSVETKHQEKLDALQVKVAAADSEKATRASAAEAAEGVTNAKNEMLEAVKAAGAAVAEARAALKVAEQEQKDGDADLVKAEKSKTILEASINDELKSLMEGSSTNTTEQVMQTWSKRRSRRQFWK